MRILVLAISALAGALSIAGPAEALTPPPLPEKADLVFESGGRIVSMKADGSGRTILTRADAPFDDVKYDADTNPQISPDGTSITFERYLDDESTSNIMVMDRSGDSVGPLFPYGALKGGRNTSFFSEVWAPDSSRLFLIRFTAGARKFSSDVMSVKADGTGLKRLSGSTMRFSKEKVSGSLLLPFEIAPSPSGDSLLVSYSRSFGSRASQLFRMDADTGKRKLLARDASGASWSPDGSRIVFVSERDQLNKDCYEGYCSFDPQSYVMKADGSGARRLVPGPIRGSQYGPDWAPSGDRIAFTSDRTAPHGGFSSEIFSIRPDGKCLTRLTNGSPESSGPAWGPDAGREAGSGTCGDAAPHALAEVKPGPNVRGLVSPPMRLGPSFGKGLLSDIFKDGRAVSTSYNDCGALRPAGCSVPISIDSGPVCEKYAGSIFDDGTFRRMVERKGALILLADEAGGGLETIVYSGGIETGIYTQAKFHGRKVTHGDHLKIAKAMRRVTSNETVTEFEPPVFTLSEVKKARDMVRAFHRAGSLGVAAAKQDMFPQLARTYLRFGKALNRIGKVLTVKCRRRSIVPGSVELR